MKTKKLLTLIMLFVLTLVMCVTYMNSSVHADSGPKSSYEITITNLPRSDYIVAYAIKGNRCGPHELFTVEETENEWQNKDDLTLIYNNVTLPNGWKLLGISSSWGDLFTFSDSTDLIIKSGYMWPKDFILIIYDKVNNTYYLTEETQTYAFNSYFKYDMNNYDGSSINHDKQIKLEKSYNYGKEIFEFFIRLILTLVIEMLLALAFNFNKKSFIILLIVNAATQIGLNVGLNLSAYFSGKALTLIPTYIFLEVLIVGFEATLYKIFCRRGKDETRKWIITYTICANVLSFSIGIVLWFFM